MRDITPKDLIYTFTGHPGEHDKTPSTPDLLKRLDISLARLKEAQVQGESRLEDTAANCLRGALIRLSQAYGDQEVAKKVDELIEITSNIGGL